MFKFIIIVIVLIAAVAALWWTGLLTQWVPSIPTPSALMSGTPAPAPAATTTQQTPAQQPQATNDLPTQPSDASDQALSQDQAAIDTQMQGLGTDSASAQSSTNDQPVSQEY